MLASFHQENEPRCPKCGTVVIRIPRHLGDRVVSLFRPLLRYECHALACGWEGTMFSKRPKDFVAQQYKSLP